MDETTARGQRLSAAYLRDLEELFRQAKQAKERAQSPRR
jgi:hypothetical protein